MSEARPLILPRSYRTPAVLGSISGPAGNLSLGAAQATLGLLDQEELLVQGVLLQLQLLQEARGGLQLLLQSEDSAVLGFDFIHLQGGADGGKHSRRSSTSTSRSGKVELDESYKRTCRTDVRTHQSADVPLAVPLDLGDLLLVLLMLHPQVAGLHLVGLNHVAECLVRLLLCGLELSDFLQQLDPLLVEEPAGLLLGFQRERSAHLGERCEGRGRWDTFECIHQTWEEPTQPQTEL